MAARRRVPRLRLQSRMVLFLSLLIAAQITLLGLAASDFVADVLEQQVGERALQVAHVVARVPRVRQAVEKHDASGGSNQVAVATSEDASGLQAFTRELLRVTDASFIVVGDRNGIRLAHPDASKIGQPMVGGDSLAALQDGAAYVSRATGSLGRSIRGKVPIRDTEGKVVGLASVGYLMADVSASIRTYQRGVLAVAGLSVGLSILVALLIAQHFKRAILGLEPEQIARLLHERDATLQGVREGIIAVDNEGSITTINNAAIDALALDELVARRGSLQGQLLADVLPESKFLEVAARGKAEFDRETTLNGNKVVVNSIPVSTEGGVSGVVSSFRRSDEITQLTKKLSRAESHAEQLRTQKHEYSNKLHTIAGLIQIGAQDRALELIGRETAAQQDVIQLLVRAVPDPLLAGAILGKTNRAHELGLKLTVDPESSMADVPAWMSRSALVSTLGNLLDNAFEATLERADTAREVDLSMTDLGEELIFEIEDRGPGISPALDERIFERGVTTKQPERGRGLGLCIVREQLDELGGTLTYEPRHPVGTRCTVYIPKLQSQARMAPLPKV